MIISSFTTALAQKGEPLFKVRHDKSKAVVDAANASILMHDAASPLAAEQFGDSSNIDSCM